MATKRELQRLAFRTVEAWARWLPLHHASSPGLWVKFAKKGSKAESITYAQALDVALAWGWIDGQKAALDESWWLQKFCRRGVRSLWSEINRSKALAMIEAGTMQPSGMAAIELAKKSGRWASAYAPQSRATVPPDLEVALAKNKLATKHFTALDSANRYAILFLIQTAKKPETRAARIAKFVTMLAKGEKLHP
jgi:uncharacterized protein YdeI (YjbR/CyaY-like superfamily)